MHDSAKKVKCRSLNFAGLSFIFQEAFCSQSKRTALPEEPPLLESDSDKLSAIPPAWSGNVSTRRRERQLTGIPSSPGIVTGTAVIIERERSLRKSRRLEADEIPDELRRFEKALRKCSRELMEIIETAPKDSPAIGHILEAQLMILNDRSALAGIRRNIEDGMSAEGAVSKVYDAQEHNLRMARDEILRERAVDLENVKQRLLAYLRNKRLKHELPANSILIAPSLTPSQVMLFHEESMLGFVTEMSGIASHTSIMARSIHVPSVIGIKHLFKNVHAGDKIIVDGFAGILVVNPRPETLLKYQRRIGDLETKRKKLLKFAKLPTETSDGAKIKLYANADSLEDVDASLAYGAQGIGLVRTETMVFRGGEGIPSESEQRKWYTQLAERAYPLPVTIRAFDLGGDKWIDGLAPESNPALGVRGLRYLLQQRKVFRDQIKAVLRASTHRNVRFMLPMVTGLEDFQRALGIIEKCKASLRKAGISFDQKMPIGAMIETPSAALLADQLASKADFLSIGTNDLTQYTLAADRINVNVASFFDSFNPAVLRLIKMVVEAGRKSDVPVGICGEFAAHAASTGVLIGLGVTDLSVAPETLLETKRRIRKTSAAHARSISQELLLLSEGSEIRKRIRAIRKK